MGNHFVMYTGWTDRAKFQVAINKKWVASRPVDVQADNTFRRSALHY